RRFLHSFPTRRSSDLKCDGYSLFRSGNEWASTICLRTGHNGDKCRDRVEWAIVFFGKSNDWQSIIAVFYSIYRIIGLCYLENSKDRKSTRLNSSHVKI